MNSSWKYLQKSEIENSPSRKDGISFEEETRIKRAFSSFIQQVGIGLDLPFTTLCTACVYFHRFYSVVSFSQHDASLCAQACILLAAKAEENSRRVRDVINVAYALQHSDKNPLQVSESYWVMKEQVIRMEQVVLRVFGFDMDLRHPHQYVLHFIRDLEGSEELASVAWCILNDSMETSLCLQYPAHSVACSAIYLAQEMMSQQVAHGEWYMRFNTNRMELEDICSQLCDAYENSADNDQPSSEADVFQLDTTMYRPPPTASDHQQQQQQQHVQQQQQQQQGKVSLVSALYR